MICYCKKCGWNHSDLGIAKNRKTNCIICNSQLYEVPHEYIDNFRWRDGDGKQAVIDELVKPSLEFDQYLFDHRDEILAKKNAELNAKLEVGKAIGEGKKVSRDEILSGRLNDSSSYLTVTCPYCQSTNTTKISTTAKVANTALFGIFGTKRHKNYHCNNCKSDF